METIFDHGTTKEEIRILFGNPDITKDKMLSFGFSQMQHYVGIYKLYMIRKDREKAQEYFKKARELGFYEFRL
jgi:hypothetical protein